MTKITLLLDLDDTLLDTNMEAFIPAYFQALSGALAGRVAPEAMLPALMGGTNCMLANDDPAHTLCEVFDAHFFPTLGIEREVLQPQIDSFYDTVFPTLRGVTNPRSGAIELVEWAFSKGHRLAIATNPLFPLKAIHHRLRWAGLPPEKYAFALVSSYETFHFSKSIPAYFTEVMGQLGWPEEPVVMVGNDIEMDLRPAQAAGLPVFWVKASDDGTPEHADLPQGTLAGLRSWLESVDPQALQPSFEKPAALLAVLRATPAAITALTGSLPDEKWQYRPQPGEWCLTEILCHLRDVESEVNLPRIRRALAEENPFIAGEVTDRWVEERQYSKQDGRAALTAFVEARKEALGLLGGLQTEWSRPARHAIFGPTTLQELVGLVAGHDRLHLQQIWKTIGK
jgi:FMN phosphatase YigB (HAD superfamily)